MSWQQDILNASVSMSRLIWAINDRLAKNQNEESTGFKNEEEMVLYAKREIKEAMKDLNKAIIEMDNQLNFSENEN